MGFIRRLLGIERRPDYRETWITVRCKRCSETIRARVDLRNDLSIQYGEDGGDTTYFCRKTIMGENLCFQRIEVELTFDEKKNIINRKIQGGEFIDAPQS